MIGLVLLSLSLLCSACSKPETDSSKRVQTPGAQPQSSASQTDLPMPEADPIATPTSFAEASNEADRRIKEVFQDCDNDLTYTLSGQHITEIEGFDYQLEAAKEKPDRIDLKNEKTWFGRIVIHSMSSRQYDILNACWSKYDGGLNTSFGLTREDGKWMPASSFPDQKRPTCQDVLPYLSNKKICR